MGVPLKLGPGKLQCQLVAGPDRVWDGSGCDSSCKLGGVRQRFAAVEGRGQCSGGSRDGSALDGSKVQAAEPGELSCGSAPATGGKGAGLTFFHDRLPKGQLAIPKCL